MGIKIIIVAITLMISHNKNIKYIMSNYYYIERLINKRYMPE